MSGLQGPLESAVCGRDSEIIAGRKNVVAVDGRSLSREREALDT